MSTTKNWFIVKTGTVHLTKAYVGRREADRYVASNPGTEVLSRTEYQDRCNQPVKVKSVMGGEVTIRAVDRGGPLDPSMESYWAR